MSTPRRRSGEVVLVALTTAVLVPVERDREVTRLLQPQPPLPIPDRTFPRPFPGCFAYQVLGHRIITAYRS